MKYQGRRYLYLLLPFLILWFWTSFLPGLLNLALSLFQVNLAQVKFVGIGNYLQLLKDPEFWVALKNTLKYLMVVPLLQLSALALAFTVASLNTSLGRLSLTLLYIPVITSVVVSSTAFKLMLSDYGLVNKLLSGLGLNPIGWLSNPYIALYSVMLVTFWRGLGYYAIIYYSSITAIPKEIFEAAILDGAGPLTMLFKFTLPMIWPTALMCTLLSSLSALKVFGEVYVMTGGGPGNSTLTLSVYAYQKAFSDLSFGYGASVSMILAILSAFISYLLVRMRYRRLFSDLS